jgi:S-DNA-T family DNA segregation ATPase FtsK/SpoIIIE
MPFLADVAGRRAAVDIAATHPEATAADLIDALFEHVAGDGAPRAWAADPILVVDGLEVPASAPLASFEITRGCEVRVQSRGAPLPADPPPPDPGSAEVRAVGGLHAGRRVMLGPGRHLLGRSAPSGLVADDATVSAAHAELRIEAGRVVIEDTGSTNGTWLGGRPVTGAVTVEPGHVPRLGATELALGEPSDDDRASLPFNRPPRRLDPSPHQLIDPPPPPTAAARPVPVGVVTALAPAAIGLVMVLLLHSLVWGALALLGPVTLLGGSWEQRRRSRRHDRRERRRFDGRVADLAAALSLACDVEVTRLRRLLPDPAEACRRMEAPSKQLWERRPSHPDWLVLRAGTGTVAWSPPVAGEPGGWAPEVAARVRDAARLDAAPVAVDLSHGGVVGVAGPREAALAVARSLVLQATATHGPADLLVAVAADDDRAGAWTWASWLPHSVDERVVPSGVTLLLVVDVAAGLGRGSSVRPLLQRDDGSVAGIVVADRVDRLPSSCTSVIDLTDDHGGGRVTSTRGGIETPDLLAAGVPESVAEHAARRLAPLDDPESLGTATGLPRSVRLLDLLDPLDDPVADRSAAATPLGVGADGQVVDVDLDRDGPHLLVAGTTGSGKSELLRSLVAGLAARTSPELLTFLLVDFKGGSAFDRLGALPHTVGVVSDLDPDLAERALRCLDAELRWREQQLRTTGATDVADHRRRAAATAPPVPRLVVVVDEFATLATDLPEVLDALLSAAQRGRSLGVHLVLATQRPTGAVSDNIRANVALRIALRLHDAADSVDVIDSPAAAGLPPSIPGRAIVRGGAEPATTVQVAHVSTQPPPTDDRRVTVVPFPRPPDVPAAASISGVDSTPTDLDAVVDACCAAFAASGASPPRPVWTPPLPDELPLSQLAPCAGSEANPIVVGRLDVPDERAHLDLAWDLDAGPLLLVGATGSGLTTTLASLALQATARPADRPTHLYLIDGAARELARLTELPGVGDVVGPGDLARQRRLVRRLAAELRERRHQPAGTVGPRVLLLIDDLGSLLRAWDDPLDDVLDQLGALFCGGSAAGIHVVVSADRLAAVPAPWQAAAVQRWMFRVADPFETRGRATPPGRLTALPSGHLGQVARADGGLDAVLGRWAAPWPAGVPQPEPVGQLPTEVRLDELTASVQVGSWPWTLPVGIGEHDLGPAGFTLHGGDAALVAGPRRSGRSNVLATIAVTVATVAADRDPTVMVVAPDRSPLAHLEGRHRRVPAASAVTEARALLEADRHVLLLVDDADLLPDDAHGLDTLLAERPPNLVTVVAATSEVVRSRYGHVARAVGRGGLGLLLRPDPDLDGDLLGVRLPRRAPVALGVGRGWLVSAGEPEVVQTPQALD